MHICVLHICMLHIAGCILRVAYLLVAYLLVPLLGGGLPAVTFLEIHRLEGRPTWLLPIRSSFLQALTSVLEFRYLWRWPVGGCHGYPFICFLPTLAHCLALLSIGTYPPFWILPYRQVNCNDPNVHRRIVHSLRMSHLRHNNNLALRFPSLERTQRNQKPSGCPLPNFWRP